MSPRFSKSCVGRPMEFVMGSIPLLLTVFAIVHEKEVAFYKDGTFLRELNGEAMLLTD